MTSCSISHMSLHQVSHDYHHFSCLENLKKKANTYMSCIYIKLENLVVNEMVDK